MNRNQLAGLIALAALLMAGVLACGGGDDDRLTIYAGRSSSLIQPLLEQFSEDTGIKIRVKYGSGTDLALGILEEGDNSPADVYYAQDVGALGALNAAGRTSELPQGILDLVPAAFRSPESLWVGISGRARVIAYSTDLDPAGLPDSILDYTGEEWRGRLGIVPRADGFPEFVTALRLTRGDDFARQWLEELDANDPVVYPNNVSAIQAVANGEIDVAYINHYYLYQFLAERGDSFPVRNYWFDNGDIGGLFLVSGATILNTADNREDAEAFLEYLLSEKAQQYFTENTHEYPLVEGVEPGIDLPPLSQMKPPEIDLSDLSDLEGSLELMRQTGILP